MCYRTMMLLTVILVNILISGSHATQGEEIATKSGKVRGTIQPSSLSGIKVQTFFNIPYAEPPVGELRFEKPQPKKPWNGTLNSTEEIIACFQREPKNYKFKITEDCLILNVLTPYPRPMNASVMVWIHGGAFRIGAAGEYNSPNFVAVGNVILVTINYRLSVLGFLTTSDDRIKGNFGLYDQRLAMKWVKMNIESFGGNPNSITIFGQSAGGASVSIHTLSPGSWPYFDRAILQSGNTLIPWGIITDWQATGVLGHFISILNCNNDKTLLQCLRNISADTMKDVLAKNYDLPMAPTIDGEFLPDHPENLLKQGAVKKQDVILGINKDEMFFLLAQLLTRSKDVKFYQAQFENVIKNHFKNSSEEVYEKARELYVPKCIPSYLEALKPIVAFQSDVYFICATKHEAVLRSKLLSTSSMYFYQYSHASLVTKITELYPYGTFGFAGHGLDIESLFGSPINNTQFLPEDQTLSMRMILYWTNFALTGDPNVGETKLPMVVDNVNSLPTWPQYTRDDEKYLDMESFSQMVVRRKLREPHCKFLMDPEKFVKKKSTTSATGNSKSTPTGSTGNPKSTPTGSTGNSKCTPTGSTGHSKSTPTGSTGNSKSTPTGSTGHSKSTPTGSTGDPNSTTTGSTGNSKNTPTGFTGNFKSSTTASTGNSKSTSTGSIGNSKRMTSGSTGNSKTILNWLVMATVYFALCVMN